LRTDDHLERGRVIKDGAEVWADTVPTGLEVTEDFVRRGQERFNIFCAPCHGWSGLGDGPIHRRAQSLVDGSPTLSYGTVWVQPKNLHEQIYIDQPIGQIYATVTLGARSMAGYKAQIPVEDRWAIAAYVKALQSSETVAETMIETVAAPAEEN
ncbi:MAG: cytochrome c, partial [Planctomycetota bacterium]|nr:cytochrome c [Planctomycetota bacterium]